MTPGQTLARHTLFPARGRVLSVADMLSVFQRHGHHAYVCGGAVRDVLLYEPFNDIDLVIGTSFAIIKDVLHSEFGAACILKTAPNFGLIKIGRDQESEIDITMLRSPEDIGNAEKLEDVVYLPRTSLLDDASNRDLTVNCVYWNPLSGFVDPLGGAMDDISNRRIEVAADPRKCRIDTRLSFRIMLFSARGYSMSESAENYLSLNIERDMQGYSGETLDRYIFELVRGSRDLAAAVLRLGQRHLQNPIASAALAKACSRV